MRTTYLSWATGFISGLNYVGSMLFIFLVVCFCFVMYSFCVLCRMLSVDCAFLIASSVFSHVYLPKTMRFVIFLVIHLWSKWLGIDTGTCGQDPMMPPLFFLDVAPPFFFNIDFFSYKQHFATFYVSLYCIYCRYVILLCQKTGMDRNYCLIVFIVYMSYSDT